MAGYLQMKTIRYTCYVPLHNPIAPPPLLSELALVYNNFTY